ncbi:MAG: hypothetical protein CMF48_05580 [Legionellales bacterium]|nr:hypothetical protein [Legionellales bacterium]|tara:strand:+ start:401 stop:754 length:354 start_codon:yes stop_codon:yes gene_type:complete
MFSIKVAALITLLMIINFLIIHPVCSLVSILRTDSIESRSRYLWLMGVLLTWSIGNIAWAVFGRCSRFFKYFTLFSILMLVASLSYIRLNFESLPESVKSQWQNSLKANSFYQPPSM